MRRLSYKRILALGTVTIVLTTAAGLVVSDRIVASAGSRRIYAASQDLPKADVALVLGTSPRIKGRKNLFYEARLDAAAALFRAGIVRGLLVSGDNSRRDYDEPTWMKKDLVARGIPAEFITCDFAGFSTLDSIGRARPVFGQTRLIVVSQHFHLERALFLARAAGLDAVGFAAEDAPASWRLRIRAREALARVKALGDVLLRRQPKFLGKREPVNLAANTMGR